jgi:hypothetical protein
MCSTLEAEATERCRQRAITEEHEMIAADGGLIGCSNWKIDEV